MPDNDRQVCKLWIILLPGPQEQWFIVIGKVVEETTVIFKSTVFLAE